MIERPSASDLSVGLVLDRRIPQPRWVTQAISHLRGLQGVKLEASIQPDPADGLVDSRPRRRFYRFYASRDSSHFVGREKSLLEAVPLEGLLEGLRTIGLEDFRSGRLQPRLDVIVDFTSEFLGRDLQRHATFGVWFHVACDPEDCAQGPPGLWSVLERKPVAGSALIAVQPDGSEVLLYRSYSATDDWSVSRTSQRLYAKLSTFAARKLAELRRLGSLAAEPLTQSIDSVVRGLGSEPSLATIAWPLVSLARRLGTEKARFRHEVDAWSLLYRLGGDDRLAPDLSAYTVLRAPPGLFYADPFPVFRDGRRHVFFEECPIGTDEGVISVVEVFADGRCSPAERVLERPYHLSYPFVFEHRGSCYMVPETSENACVEIYRCVQWPAKWERLDALLEETAGVDATIQEIDGLFWMFVSVAIDGVSFNDEMSLFYSESPLGPWRPHAANPVKSDVTSSRGAGAVFHRDGRWYRPSQNCSVRYGYSVTLNRIVELSPTTYREERVGEILPTWPQGSLGVHTINHCAGLSVADANLRVPRNTAVMNSWYGKMARVVFDRWSSARHP